jgi:hypothetical protein
MDFRITHRFPGSAQAWWGACKHPDFEAVIAHASDVTMTLVSDETVEGVRRQRVRVVPRKELPALVQKAVGASRFSYVQETEERVGETSLRWKVLPEVLADKIRCAGTLRLTDVPGGCERTVEGSMEVRVTLVGGTIEKAVFDELRQGDDRSAVALLPVLARLTAGGTP